MHVEARIRAAGAGKGIWSALWALPPDPKYGSEWPASGEIDIMGVIDAATSATQGIHFGGGCERAAGRTCAQTLCAACTASFVLRYPRSRNTRLGVERAGPPYLHVCPPCPAAGPLDETRDTSTRLPGRQRFSDAFHTFGLEWRLDEMKSARRGAALARACARRQGASRCGSRSKLRMQRLHRQRPTPAE